MSTKTHMHDGCVRQSLTLNTLEPAKRSSLKVILEENQPFVRIIVLFDPLHVELISLPI